MKTLSSYIKSDKSSFISLSKKLVINQQVDEKLVINKKFRDDDYKLNNVLKETWKQIENDKDMCTQLDEAKMFVEVAGIADEFNIILSSIDEAADATRSFRRCKHIYMLNSKDYIPIIDALFIKLGKENIELNQLVYDKSTGFSVEYKETDDFIILVCGDETYYLTFIGKLN